MQEIMNETKLNKLNDTMTMVTLGKTITINQADYTDLIEIKTKYEALIEAISASLVITQKASPIFPLSFEISHSMRQTIPAIFKALEPEAFNWRVKQLEHETRADQEG